MKSKEKNIEEIDNIVTYVILLKDFLLHLSTFLTGHTILKCMCVCKKWNEVLSYEREKRTLSIYQKTPFGIRKLTHCDVCNDTKPYYDKFVFSFPAYKFHITCKGHLIPVKKCTNWYHHLLLSPTFNIKSLNSK